MIANLRPSATLLDQAYRAILEAICEGSLAAGERLTQEGIAERLNVSRQPVSQALALLKTQGFVKEIGRRGLVVAHLDPAFFNAIYELRSAIDPMAARLAAANMSKQTRQDGTVIIKEGHRALRSGELHALVHADVRFHTYIYKLSGNPLVVDFMNLYWNHLRRAMGEVLQKKGEAKVIWRQHEEIFQAMAGGDADEAGRIAKAHVDFAVGRVLQVVASKT